ncbi:hypothetical protein BGZ47_010444, partial [Haplosporangium gracile]
YTNFGGPMVHTNMLNDGIIIKRGWVSQEQFAKLFAISHLLPGPAAALLAYSLTLLRSGFLCAILGFILWSFPGAAICTVARLLIGDMKSDQPVWAICLEQGLAAASIGLVALAAHKMSRNLTTDNLTRVLVMCAASVSISDKKKRLRQRGAEAEVVAASLKDDLKKGRTTAQETELGDDEDNYGEMDDSTKPLSSGPVQSDKEEIFTLIIGKYDEHEDTLRKPFSYSRKLGSIIFGGGPVIIPLFKTYVIDSGWMTSRQFLIGLSLVQSLPAVAMVNIDKNGLAGAIVSYIAIFCPGLVLKSVITPFWQLLRERPAVKRAFRGVNARVILLGGSDGYHVVIADAAFVTAGFLRFSAPVAIILGDAMGAIEYAVCDRYPIKT